MPKPKTLPIKVGPPKKPAPRPATMGDFRAHMAKETAAKAAADKRAKKLAASKRKRAEVLRRRALVKKRADEIKAQRAAKKSANPFQVGG